MYHDIKVEIEMFEYTNLKGGDCGFFQCPTAVFAWTEREIQYPQVGCHENSTEVRTVNCNYAALAFKMLGI